MKDIWKTIRLGVYICALPLVATAAASAHQWISNSAPVTAVSVPAATSPAAIARIDAIRNHTVTINDQDEVQGRVATINPSTSVAFGMSNMKVYFLQNGKVIKKSSTNEDGSFVVRGLDEGIYSFVAIGQNGVAAYGVNVVKAVGDTQNYMEAAAISPNVKSVRKIIADNLSSELSSEVTADITKAQSLQPSVFAGSNQVALTESGLMNGRVVSLTQNKLQDMYAYILKSDKQIAKTSIDSRGNFSVPDMKPGVYDLVVAGPNGVAAVSFEALADKPEEVIEEVYTALQDEAPATMDVALAAQDDFSVVDDAGMANSSVVYDSAPESPIEYAGECVSCGVAAGASCGGSGDFGGYESSGCCGGGGGGGFGGFGGVSGGGFSRLGLIGVALGAVGIALGASNGGGGGGGGGGMMSPEDT